MEAAGAVVREYLAILAQETGWRRAARRLRRHPDRDETVIPVAVADVDPVSPLHDDVAPPLVVDTGGERQLFFAHDALQSRMRLDDPDALIEPYTRQMMCCLLFAPDPAHLLLIGLGGGSMSRFCCRYLPRTCITTVEVDERVIRLRETFHIPPDDERFRIVHQDGAQYVAAFTQQVDAILVDAFDAQGVSPSLMTAQFFADARERLTDNGALIMNLHGDPGRFSAGIERARAAFPGRLLLVPVQGTGNVLLCGLGRDADSPASPPLFLRARHLQSVLRLNFRYYLERVRQAQREASAAGV